MLIRRHACTGVTIAGFTETEQPRILHLAIASNFVEIGASPPATRLFSPDVRLFWQGHLPERYPFRGDWFMSEETHNEVIRPHTVPGAARNGISHA